MVIASRKERPRPTSRGESRLPESRASNSACGSVAFVAHVRDATRWGVCADCFPRDAEAVP